MRRFSRAGALAMVSAVALVSGSLAAINPSTASAADSGTTATAVAAAGNNACAVTAAGGVECWGYNYLGELGDGSVKRRLSPVNVVGLSSGVTAIAATAYTTCALTTAGTVKCWGQNSGGELGIGTVRGPEHCAQLACSREPVEVEGLATPVTQIAAYGGDFCALTSTHRVKCWGDNSHGGAGTGSTHTAVDKATTVTGLSGRIVQISGRCALNNAGAVFCWGYNANGEVGDGTTTDRFTPVPVVGLSSGVHSIANGCAVMNTGGVKCWGAGYEGQLGDGSSSGPELCGGLACSTTPVDVTGLDGPATIVATGDGHSCAITTSGGVDCWGSNTDGELGAGLTVGPEQCTGQNACSTAAVAVLSLAGPVAAISAGSFHTCAVTTAGVAQCWGSTTDGQLGIGTRHGPEQCQTGGCSDEPVDVLGLAGPTTAP